ncbi:MAG: DUF3793 family protein [Clostridiales bacterium]|nr:DUF3793 family protein [Clostridiales bacterium]
MNRKRLENGLIRHCAPTLAGLKSASLFQYFYDDKGQAIKQIKEVNQLLNGRGVYVDTLQWNENAVLIYTYRFHHVQKELENPKGMELLMKYGYQSNDVEGCIINSGQNCKYCGLWKVYCDEKEKMQLFHKLKKCSEIYLQAFSKGRRIEQMTVCA